MCPADVQELTGGEGPDGGRRRRHPRSQGCPHHNACGTVDVVGPASHRAMPDAVGATRRWGSTGLRCSPSRCVVAPRTVKVMAPRPVRGRTVTVTKRGAASECLRRGTSGSLFQWRRDHGGSKACQQLRERPEQRNRDRIPGLVETAALQSAVQRGSACATPGAIHLQQAGQGGPSDRGSATRSGWLAGRLVVGLNASRPR